MVRRVLLWLCLSTVLWARDVRASPSELQGVVNLNEATARELEQLPGVGEKAALKIIALRQRSPFRRIEDVMRVKGIGPKKFARMRPFLSVRGASTLLSRPGG